MSRSRSRTAMVLLAASVGLLACSTDRSRDASTGATDQGTCPAPPVSVVVTVDQWGEIVQALAGACGDVTTIIEGSSGDPHDYEPTPADNAALADADLVVLNGLAYDGWAADAVDARSDEPAIVDAGAVVGLGDGANPHIWYGPDYVQQVAAAVTTELSSLSPVAAAYFDQQADRWRTDLRPYLDRVEAVRAAHAGTPYAATETVFDYLGQALGLDDATPPGYRNASANESDPSPGDINAFEEALTGGAVHVLVFNTQTVGSVPEQLRGVAEASSVPVVEITETVPAGRSFVDWQVGQLDALSEALA